MVLSGQAIAAPNAVDKGPSIPKPPTLHEVVIELCMSKKFHALKLLRILKYSRLPSGILSWRVLAIQMFENGISGIRENMVLYSRQHSLYNVFTLLPLAMPSMNCSTDISNTYSRFLKRSRISPSSLMRQVRGLFNFE